MKLGSAIGLGGAVLICLLGEVSSNQSSICLMASIINILIINVYNKSCANIFYFLF